MFRSIFQRLLFTYAVIILLAITLLAALITYFLNLYLFHQKQQQLFAAGRRAEELVQEYVQKKIDQDDLTLALNSLGQVTDSRIRLHVSKKLSELKSHGDQVQEILGETGIAEDIRPILEGGTVTRKRQFSSQLNTYVVFVGMPVYINGTVCGVVLLFSPLDQINKALFEVYKIIWGTAAASLVLAAAVVFITSRRISRPIEDIQKSAAAIAEGEFTEDVVPSGKDEIAQLAGTFNYMKNRLKQVEEMRKNLIANVSHELRTPLTSVRGFIQGILEGVIGPADREKYLRRAYEETGRLSRLVDDLLQLARIQSGSLKLNKEMVDVGELIGEIIEEVSLLARQKRIALSAEAAGEGITALADRDRLKQIILNLLHNAVNYTGDGGRVRVRAGAENGKCTVTVQDDGPGIPEDQLELIFEKFHRVEESRSRQAAGTGLGLSIARELVELHGGAISARSEVGRGTEITFSLPSG
ncbi:MAG: cell wall metabolism sensor histidine kinase WalK [Peptococcaceae bacterium]|nr:cell wall metabolism sensor histidine kinase WalK [Peptococcaceae bacterium]